jgi:hypothetical protein
MSWSKLFIRANIKEMKGLFIATIVWSWYNLTNWTEIEIFQTKQEAEIFILNNRVNGSLTYS